jgi:hypothetical protein
MTPAQYQSVTLVLCMAALLGSIPIAKRGSAALSESQMAELRAMGPDPIAMAGPVVMLTAAYMAKEHAWAMAAVVAAALVAMLWRVPYRQWKTSWPLVARRYLVAGNCVLAGGVAGASLLYISQFL